MEMWQDYVIHNSGTDDSRMPNIGMCVACVKIDMRSEADLGMFSMFGRTGAPTKGGPHRPEIVERYAMDYVLEA